MAWAEKLIGFTHTGSTHPLVRRLNDGVCHRACLNGWDQRDEFVRAWNREVRYVLGPRWYLEVTRSGRVRYLTWLGRWLHARGWKRSPLLPPPIRPDRPQLLFQAVVGSDTPFVLHTRNEGADCPPTPEGLGLPAELAAEVRRWFDGYTAMVDTDRGWPAADEWAAFNAEGERLWAELVRHLGDRYRVVHRGFGRLCEPDDD